MPAFSAEVSGWEGEGAGGDCVEVVREAPPGLDSRRWASRLFRQQASAAPSSPTRVKDVLIICHLAAAGKGRAAAEGRR